MPRDNFPQDPDFSRSFNPPDLSGLDSLNFIRNRKTDKQGQFEAEVIFRNEGVILPESMTAVHVSKDSPILDVIRKASENYQTVIMAFTEDENLYTPESFYPVALECAVGNPIFADANNVIFLFQACVKEVHLR